MKRRVMIPLCLCGLILVSTLSLKTLEKEDYHVISISESKLNLKAGTYFVKLNADNEQEQTMSQYKKIHLKYPKTSLNYAAQEGIDAHDLIVKTGSFDPDDLEGILTRTNAHSWDLETGAELNELYVDVESSKQSVFHTVTFSTVNNTKTSVNVIEQDEVYLDLEDLYMNRYSMFTSHLKTLSALIIILAVLPGLIFMGLFKYITKRSKSIFDLVEIKEKGGVQ